MNTVKTQDGIEIYTHEIYRLVDEFIENKIRGETRKEKEEELKNKRVFHGLLKYIYVNLFKITDHDIKYNNKNSRLDYNDIDLLDNIWDIYSDLCSTYKQDPFLLGFSVLTGINNTTLTTWKNGEYRKGDGGASSAHSLTVKKWDQECEYAQVVKASDGNPGGMFLCKSNYGYVEQAQRIEIVGQGAPQISTEELLRLRQERREIPQKPDLDG